MTLFCEVGDLVTESDVEQKLLWHILTQQPPLGLGYTPAEIQTKHDIRSLTIGKGANERLYFPDYAAILAGLPILIAEAKNPNEDLAEALREARLYAAELNAQFPTSINPCIRLVATNGREIASSAWDSNVPDASLSFSAVNASSIEYAKFISLNSKATVNDYAAKLLDNTTRRPFYLPLEILGGVTVRNEEIGQNTFGATLKLDYKHLFNPTTSEERAFIVKHAYVRSLRRDRYVEPIDRLIRAASPPSVTDAKLVEDTAAPTEIIARLRKHKALEHQVLLLVGGVGAGKSTFVDHFREVALSEDLKERTTWINIDLNYAPLSEEEAYKWITSQITRELQLQHPEIDFDDIETIQKVYSVEVAKLRKGPLSLLDATSTEYKTRWVDGIHAFQSDYILTAKAMVRYLVGDRGKLLILVLDNCDKRTRDEQLLMFQLAQWVQREIVCLVFLPIRDVTYDHHRNEPPLDTALKDLVFRIEPPQFAKVLHQRVRLALAEMSKDKGTRKLTYVLPNGMKVEYPRSDQGIYLAAILRSLYEYDRLIRRTITGLAGRDIRRAMEIFLEFCTSGHIGEHEILKIRQSEGAYTLPYDVVVRVLLRMNRRFYEGDKSYIRNVFRCDPSDDRPDLFCRIAILAWLRANWPVKGPTGVKGYHQVQSLVKDLVPFGHDADVVRRELLYLIQSQCAIAEHQRTDSIQDEDLVCLSPAGVVHLDLTRNCDYMAACAEDTWYDEAAIAHEVAGRIGNHGPAGHYSITTTMANAREFSRYITDKSNALFPCPTVFMKNTTDYEVEAIEESRRSVERALHRSGIDLHVGNLHWDVDDIELDLLFSKRVPIISARVIRDSATGRSKGWGIVRVNFEDVAEAISSVNGIDYRGRPINVSKMRYK